MNHDISQCRICGNRDLVEILDLGEQALTGVFPRTKDDPVERGPLQLVKCDEKSASCCGLVQLGNSFEPQHLYGENYGYRSGLNPSMVRHLQGHVRDLLAFVQPQDGDVILDIGSNDCTLLRSYPTGRFRLIGIDPTAEKFRRFYPENIERIPSFFSEKTVRDHLGSGDVRIITSIAMFYDLEKPLQFALEVRNLLRPDGVWLFEQSYLPSTLATNSYDTVCHEHLEYYRFQQVQFILREAGLKPIRIGFNPTNGGSFSVTAARIESIYPECGAQSMEILARENHQLGLHTLTPYLEFQKNVRRVRQDLCNQIAKLKSVGRRIFGMAASTKGNVILQYCGLGPDDIQAIMEINADKFGCFTPGTGIPIISEEETVKRNPQVFLVLPWHFRSFFMENPPAGALAKIPLLFPLPEVEIIQP